MKKSVKIALPCLGALAIGLFAFKNPNIQKEESIYNTVPAIETNVSGSVDKDQQVSVLDVKVDTNNDALVKDFIAEDHKSAIIADYE
jgi:hypothetical protein